MRYKAPSAKEVCNHNRIQTNKISLLIRQIVDEKPIHACYAYVLFFMSTLRIVRRCNASPFNPHKPVFLGALVMYWNKCKRIHVFAYDRMFMKHSKFEKEKVTKIIENKKMWTN